jgi:hypothetical protein
LRRSKRLWPGVAALGVRSDMWSQLPSPDLDQHYQELTEHGHDFAPMSRVLAALRAEARMPKLQAFTSHDILVLTEAPSYEEARSYSGVAIQYFPNERTFSVSIGRLLSCQGSDFTHRLEEPEVVPLVLAFLNRLLDKRI